MRCHRLILVASMAALIGAASGTGFAARESSGTPAARSAFDKGEAAARAGKLDEAVAAFRKAIAADPDFVDAHQRLIEVTQRQQLQDAESASLPRLKRQYEQWARQHPTRAVYQVALGLLTKDADQSDAYYNKALALDPSSASAHALLARNADTRGDWDTQRTHLKAAVENNPGEPRYLLRYAVAHVKSDPDRFRELALQVVARFPTSPSAAEALYNLADASSNRDRRGYLDRLPPESTRPWRNTPRISARRAAMSTPTSGASVTRARRRPPHSRCHRCSTAHRCRSPIFAAASCCWRSGIRRERAAVRSFLTC